MRELLWRVAEIYRPFRKASAALFGLMALEGVVGLISPFIYGMVINMIVGYGSFWTVVQIAGLVFGIKVLTSGIIFVRECYELNHLDFHVREHVQRLTLEKLLSFSLGQHSNQNSGSTQSILARGESSLTALANMTLYNFLPMILQTSVTIVALCFLSLELGLLVLIGATAIVLTTLAINRRFRPQIKKAQKMARDNDKFESEILRNLALIQINSQESRMVNEFQGKYSAYTSFARKVWLHYTFWNLLRTNIVPITQFFVLFIGAVYVYEGVFLPGLLVTFLFWTQNAMNHLTMISHLQRQALDCTEAIRKYFAVIDTEPAVKLIENPIRPPYLSGRIEFSNVSFTYPEKGYDPEDEDGFAHTQVINARPHALKNVSLVINPGERVAFVGPSGAGKTTIVKLILRGNDPDEGEILVDGVNLRNLDLGWFREKIGVVEQNVALFDDTIRYNLVFGLNGRGQEVTTSELEEVARLARIDAFYDRLTDGFNTIVGERGIKLSGGQCQRVGIARALIKNPGILIFDEATSSLDAESEGIIKGSIDLAAKGRTTIVIAHRLSTVIGSDRIFVVDAGQIVSSGKHNELLQSCELYGRLVANQILK